MERSEDREKREAAQRRYQERQQQNPSYGIQNQGVNSNQNNGGNNGNIQNVADANGQHRGQLPT